MKQFKSIAIYGFFLSVLVQNCIASDTHQKLHDEYIECLPHIVQKFKNKKLKVIHKAQANLHNGKIDIKQTMNITFFYQVLKKQLKDI